MFIDTKTLINNYEKSKEELQEYNSYINHVREYNGYIFKEFTNVNKFNNEITWLKKLMTVCDFTPEFIGDYNQNTIITKKIIGTPINDNTSHEHLYYIGKLLANLHALEIETDDNNWKKTLSQEYFILKQDAENVFDKNLFYTTTNYLESELEQIQIEKYAIIHKDLRPENVIYNNGKYFLLDFESMGIGDRDYDFIRMFNLFNQKNCYTYDDFKNFMDGYNDTTNIIFDVNKWWLYSKFYAFRMLTKILNGQINRDESFENYLLNILYQKQDKITEWINTYNSNLI